jgi:predicted transcriptional regulator of viral defense system
MNYIEFSRKMADFPLFSSNDLKLILRDKFNRSFLNNLKNWQKKGYISQIRRELYSLNSLKYAVDPMALAAKIYSPSYVSLEAALNYYGIIPEAVFTVTSVTTRETAEFSTDFGRFTFRKIKKEAFGGYETLKSKEFEISFNLAIPEKALVDFFYLNRNILDGSRTQFEGYRFNEEFKYSKNKLLKFAKSFENKKVLLLTDKFIKFYVAG